MSVNHLDPSSSFGARSRTIEGWTDTILRVVFLRNDVLEDMPDQHGFTVVAHC